ncbi:alpha-N-acetylgalactosaminide alpha-2,6-sialyltransferase 2-like [Hoplias malabaricus]|uniref:alpha-N-acetylgalactosaminide alpha-2,6-sialyltransferase 2-like n=1 Tax=Hoplias malabaricus TaxID=27720 RepID=UPI003461EF03
MVTNMTLKLDQNMEFEEIPNSMKNSTVEEPIKPVHHQISSKGETVAKAVEAQYYIKNKSVGSLHPSSLRNKPPKQEPIKTLADAPESHNHSKILKSGPGDQSQKTAIPVMLKSKFKKIPSLKTNDVYLKGEEYFQTVCAESLRKTEDPDFRKAFIPNVQMYLYQGLLGMNEWNRLAHFNNPFGFMEYNYSDLKNAVDLIPKPSINQLLPLPEKDSCIRCAVVANGGILNGSKMGKEIDSHTYVFRMNGAVTEGHEEDVGNRTSVYVHTAYSLVTSLSLFKKYGFKNIPKDKGIKYVMIPEGLRDFEFLEGLMGRRKLTKGSFQKKKPWTYYDGQFDESRFYVLHPDFLRYIRNRFMASKQLNGTHWALYRPTNGAFTLFLALHVCDIVDAYGFITDNYKDFPNYYFDQQRTNVVFFVNHDYNLEIKLWKKLHDAKIIKLFQRQ